MKKFMRGPVWSMFLLFSIFGVIAAGLMLATDGEIAGNMIGGLLIFVLYIAAYFVLPKHIKPKAPLPTVPESNSPLSVPARLTIVRDSSVAGALVPTIITLNGQQVCSLQNGASAEILLTQRYNILQTNTVGSKYVRYAFEANDAAFGELHVRGGVFQVKTVRWN
ncbi:MAG: hypothetical protein GX417_00985 [Clostridiales bacterium]|nr:hypothetical protein [Clostridiales bacterium]